MNFVRSLIEIPLFLIVIVLAVVNEDFARFTLKPFGLDITISLSVLIIILFFTGYFVGRLDGYVANAPLRANLRQHKKANKEFSKKNEKLNATVSSLQENIEHLKVIKSSDPKPSFKERIANFFKFKKS